MSTTLFVTWLALAGFSSVQGQGLTPGPQETFSCRGRNQGLYTNPFDCGGFYQCATGVSRPFVRQCAPGSLFDQFQRNCLASPDVLCNGRPILDTDPYVPSTPPPPTPRPGFQPLPQPLQVRTPPPPRNRAPQPPASRIPQPISSRIPQLQRQLTQGINTVPIRLFTENFGPQLTTGECAEIGRLVSRYVRYISNYYDPNCAADADCQNSMPVLQTQCLLLSGTGRGTSG